jgi:hypothetical protein
MTNRFLSILYTPFTLFYGKISILTLFGAPEWGKDNINKRGIFFPTSNQTQIAAAVV